MRWKVVLQMIVLIAVMFSGLGVYTSLVLKPIVIESIRQETTKTETNIKNDVENKFKKIESLHANLPVTTEAKSTIVTKSKDSICLPIENLTRRQKKRLGL